MSLDSELELDSLVTFGPGIGIWAIEDWLYGRWNTKVLNMVLVLTVDAF